ncbi:hypothetical protein HMPREF9008_04739, partial [Parabacteroides sp. 20_3]
TSSARYSNCCSQAAALVIDTVRTFFLVVLAIPRSDSLRPVGMGRFPKHAHAVDMPLYTGLSVATGIGHVQHHTGEDTGSDAAKRHRADAGRPELLAGFERRGVYRIPLHRHHRLLYHSHRCGLDYPSRRHGRLRSQREPDGGTSRKHGGQRGGCSRRKRSRTCRQIAEIINVQS